jgi:hypothetical protein
MTPKIRNAVAGAAAVLLLSGYTMNVLAVVNVSISREQWVPTIDESGIDHEYFELPGVTHGPVITASQKHIFLFFDQHSR